MDGKVQRNMARCLLDSGADNTVMPCSLATGVVSKDWVAVSGFIGSGCTAPRGKVDLELP